VSQDIHTIAPNDGYAVDDFPVDIKFGEIGAAVTCAVCRGFNNAGFFVIYKTKMRMCCVRCVAHALKRHQELNPTQTLVEFDIDISANDYKYAVKALREKYPEMDEDKALEIARTVVRAIG
jgi:hypothetical protein